MLCPKTLAESVEKVVILPEVGAKCSWGLQGPHSGLPVGMVCLDIVFLSITHLWLFKIQVGYGIRFHQRVCKLQFENPMTLRNFSSAL